MLSLFQYAHTVWYSMAVYYTLLPIRMHMKKKICLNFLSYEMNSPLILGCEKTNTLDAFSSVFDLV